MNLAMYMPLVGKNITDVEKLQKGFAAKCLRDEKEEEFRKAEGIDTIKNITFSINTLTADNNFMKRIFSAERIEQLNKTDEVVKNLEYVIELLKIEISNCAKANAFTDIERQIQKCATKDLLDDIRDDLQGKANRADFNIVIAENEELKKKTGNFVSTYELNKRLDVL